MKVTNLTIQDGESEKKFTISKMSAIEAEQWMYRAALALGSSLDDLQEVFSGSPEKILHAVMRVPYDKAKPLLDDLLGCCSIVQGKMTKSMASDAACASIESPLTLTRLRIEALRLNFGFFFDGKNLNSLTGQSTATTASK